MPPLPVLGLVAVTIYTWVTTGWTAFEVQQRWSSGLSLPWNLIIASWRYVLARGNVVEAINLGLFVLFSGLVIVGLRKIPFTYTLYVLPQLLLIATRNPFHTPLISTSRYVLVLFPCFIVLAILGRRRKVHYVWLVTSAALLTLLFLIFITGPFVA